jgi:tetratricopeptide (TPR) repeat protein
VAPSGAPEPAKVAAATGESAKPEAAKPEAAKPEVVAQEAAKPEVVAPEPAKQDEATPDVAPAKGAKVGDVKAEYQKLLEEGRTLYRHGQARRALVPLEKAVALKADGDDALVLLANCHLDRGAYEKALSVAQLASAANPDNADAYLVIGAVQQQKAHNAEARAAYERYLKLSPKGQFAGEIRSILATLH